MAKQAFQKGKILYILELLRRESDENHPINAQRILNYLDENGICAERKSIYSDIETLQNMGYDIGKKGGRNGGYYMYSREFEVAELKLLVDAVQASRFVTEKKSMDLIHKLEQLTSRHYAGELQREVVVNGRAKAMNESIFYNVDSVYEAMHKNCCLAFRYVEWTVKKEQAFRHDGKVYEISPWNLLWFEENYYMIGYDLQSGELRYYRVDKMKEICLLEKKRVGEEIYKKLDMRRFSKTTFGMFAGEEKWVKLLVSNKLAGVILDRFGKDVAMYPEDADHFICNIQVHVSGQFFGWLAGLGSQLKVLEPEEVVVDYRRHLLAIVENM